MNLRKRSFRALGMGLLASLVGTSLSAVTATPTAGAAPTLPGPESAAWITVTKSGAALLDPSNDLNVAHLNLTPAGGALGNATVQVSADLSYAYFRFHVAAAPAGGATGGYVVQLDTNGSTSGWEAAVRFDLATNTVGVFTAADAGQAAPGTRLATVPSGQVAATTYAGEASGAFVAFAVPRARLTAAGVTGLGRIVAGATTLDDAALNNYVFLGLGQPPSDILGTGKATVSPPAWSALATDAPAIDSDGDGIADDTDNCPLVANPGQEDSDAATDNAPPFGTPGVPDGTEGMGDACDPTPTGYDQDGDGVGWDFDMCRERPGVQDNGCPGTSNTIVTATYNAKKKLFKGTTRGGVHDECTPKRTVSLRRVAPGADPEIKFVRSNKKGKYKIKLKKKPKKGTYYVRADRKPMIKVGVTCFPRNSPKIKIR